MNGAISSYSAESARRLPPRFAIGGQVDGGGGMQAGLFEQLLSMPMPMQTPPRDASAPPDDESLPPVEAESAADKPSDAQASTVDEDDDETPSESSPEAILLLNATTPAAPVEDAEETVEVSELHRSQLAAAAGQNAGAEKPSREPSEVGAEQSQSDPLPVQPALERVEQVATQNPESGDASLQTSDDSQTDARDRDPVQSEQIAAKAAGELAVEPSPDVDNQSSDEELASETQSQTDVEAQEATPAHHDRDERQPRREKWYEGNGEANVGAESRSRGADNVSRNATAPSDGPAANAEGVPTPAAAEPPANINSQRTIDTLPAMSPNVAPTPSVTPPTATTGSTASAATSVAASEVPANENTVDGSPAPAAGSANRRTSHETKGAAQPHQASDLSQQERVRLVQRISRSFARLGPMGGTVNIKLHPPQLGSLNVQVRLEGRSMSAKLSTESAAARDAILESLPVLRGRLAEQGFEISQFQVEVADNRADTNSNGSAQQQAFGQSADSGSGSSQSPVDYRRLNAMHQQRLQQASSAADTSQINALTWQTTAGLDLHA